MNGDKMNKVFIGILIILEIIFIGVIILDIFVWIRKKISYRQVIVWNNQKEWENAVCACAQKWSKKMPTVPLKDEERLIIIDMLRKQYKHGALQGWQYAQLISGLKANNKKIGKLNDELFSISEIDDGYAIYHAWKAQLINENTALRLTEKYLAIVNKHTKETGLIEYREGFGDIYIVDTIAFVCPILVRYGVVTGKHRYIDLAIKQIKSYYENAYIEKYGLYAHGYNSVTNTPCESIGWGRGTGWYLLGILYCCQELYDGEEKTWIYERMIEATKNVLKYQRMDGGWSTQLISNWNYDSSATAIFATFLFNVYSMTHDDNCLKAGEKALAKLMASTRKDGAIEYCEGACHGLGKYSKNYGISPFTQGMVLDMIEAYEKINLISRDL